MPKSYTEITDDAVVVAPFGAKTTLINTGSATVLLNADEVETELSSLSATAKRGVLAGLCALRAGESKPLPVGTHRLRFSQWSGRNVVVLIETKSVNNN
jgi:hypothetical protein